MPTDNTNKSAPETAKGSEEQMLQEWRQRALMSNVVPNQIDAYLLSRPEVPEAVKALIRSQQEQRATTEQAMPAVSAPPLESGRPVESGIAGQVNVLDTKQQMEQIKREAFIEQGAVQPQKTEQPVEVRAAMQMQTAEKKELTTTQGTLSTDTGMAVRASLGISGYPPSQQIAANATEIAEKGNVNDAKTWQAILLQRFLEVWGSFKGLFTTESKSV